MGLVDMWGFEWGENGTAGVEREGLIITTNSFIWSDVVPEGGSTLSLRAPGLTSAEALAPFRGGSLSGTQFWLHFQWYTTFNNTVNDDHYISWNQGATQIGRIYLASSTNQLKVAINGVDAATSPLPVGLNRWVRVHVFVDLQSAATGIIRVYLDGNLADPVIEVTATSTNPLSATMDGLGIGCSQVRYLDNLLVMDPVDGLGVTDPEELAWVTVLRKQPTSDGNYTTWTAAGAPGGASDYEYIDGVPPLDTDYIQATAINQASTFGYEASSSTIVLGAKFKSRFLRGDAVAGVNMNIRQRDVSATTDYDTADIPVPGDGYIYRTFPEKPGGGAWTAADFDDTEFGVVSKT